MRWIRNLKGSACRLVAFSTGYHSYALNDTKPSNVWIFKDDSNNHVANLVWTQEQGEDIKLLFRSSARMQMGFKHAKSLTQTPPNPT
jgi:hypothetical protein